MEYNVSIPAPVREHRDGVKRGKREQQLDRANPDFAYMAVIRNHRSKSV
jgi:hypothetical protein